MPKVSRKSSSRYSRDSTTPPGEPPNRQRKESTSSSSSESSDSSDQGQRKRKRQRIEPEFLSVGQSDEKMIPLFDPQKPEQSIETWISRVDELAVRYHWNDLTINKLVANRLTGMARRWYDVQEQTTGNWNKMKKLLVKQFSRPLPFAKLLRDAATYETHSGQDLSEYCFNKLDKLKSLKLTIPEKYLIDAVIGGITDENIARSARASRFRDTNELYGYLSTLGKLPKSGRIESKRREFGESSKHLTMSKERPDIRCFNCNGTHRARDCPKPKIECFHCKRLGHRQNKCPNKKNDYKQKDVSEVIKDKGLNSNPYVKSVVLNGRKFKCLVDTGSSCTLIRQSVAETLQSYPKDSERAVLRSFTGEPVVTVGKVRLHVRVEQPSSVLNVFVVPNNRMMHDCIIGRDFINSPNVLLLKLGNEVFIRELKETTKPICDVVCSVVTKDNSREMCVGNIDNRQQAKLKALLLEFDDRISKTMADLGKTSAVKMKIKLISEEPIVYRPYRLPATEKELLRNILQELLQNEIIRESDSAYASPILLVKKKTGDYRMCVDYRRLNAITVKDKFPLPIIDEQLDKLGKDKEGNKYVYFTTLDLASGFYQVPMDEDSISKTAFITPDSHYEFLRMPFGLCNSPSVFQRLMNNVLGPLRNHIAFPYIDDVIIPSTTIEDGLERLRLVLETFRQHNLTLKLKKCSFFQTKVDYLGREISSEGIRPGQLKIEAIKQMHEPITVKQVRQFVGLSGYFRKFVKNYSRVVEPLTRLTRKDEKWCWTSEQQQAFENVKQALVSRPVLAIFDPSLVTELHTDACSTGVGAILFQTHHDGKQHVVAYFSKQNTADQRCYHSYELETMAVVLALQHFRVYLLGLHFTVITDCNALRTVFLKKDLIPRVGRWWLQVQDYTFEIRHRPGKRMLHVDALSRLPISNEVNQADLTEADWIVAAQLQDDQLSRIRQILEKNDRNSQTKQYFKEYKIKDNKLFRKLPDGPDLWAVPKAARWQIIRLCHDKAGHASVENTLKRIKMNYWFPKMRRFVTKYVQACLNCAYYKKKSGKRAMELHPIEKVAVPFHTIHLDHIGPFETSKNGKKFLFVIVDAFTKFVTIEAVKSTKVKPVIKILQTMMSIFGVPSRIISDRGSAFTSATFRAFCESYAIKHILNAVATPRANGQCERYNRTIINMLAPTSAEGSPNMWDVHLKEIQSALNTQFNKGINTTPVKALFGYQTIPLAEAKILNSINPSIDKVDIAQLRKTITDHVKLDQRKQKERFDKTKREAVRYNAGELVRILITSEQCTGASRKLLPKYKGPFRVTKVLYNDRYEVEDLREGHRRRGAKTVVASDKMERWITVV